MTSAATSAVGSIVTAEVVSSGRGGVSIGMGSWIGVAVGVVIGVVSGVSFVMG